MNFIKQDLIVRDPFHCDIFAALFEVRAKLICDRTEIPHLHKIIHCKKTRTHQIV